MPVMLPNDSLFLMNESREHPMHVGGLLLMKPPEDGREEFIADILTRFRDPDGIRQLFLKRPAAPVGSMGLVRWTFDKEIDTDYHIRHTALPAPGRVRELLQNVSLWHGTLLDRHRPLWEAHIVEGLSDGRIALYAKMHHALVDGVGALRLLQQSFTLDPEDMDCVPPWHAPRRARTRTAPAGPLSLVRSGAAAAGGIASLVPGALKVARTVLREDDIPFPRAPRTILNGPVGGARRFAAQSWEVERVKAVAKASGTTLNDVVLAMCSGALRAYLLEQDALPDEPLTAMVPVSLALRSGAADSGKDGGNAIGMIIVNLATNLASASARLEAIQRSSSQAKSLLSELNQAQILAWSLMQLAPLGLPQGLVPLGRPPFNVIISNVPGPRAPLYFNGAELDGMYPASIVLDGQALNITLCGRDKWLDFGLIGCRTSVPHLQRLLQQLEDALQELEKDWL